MEKGPTLYIGKKTWHIEYIGINRKDRDKKERDETVGIELSKERIKENTADFARYFGLIKKENIVSPQETI